MEIHFAKKYSTFGNCVIFILLFLFVNFVELFEDSIIDTK